MILNDSLVLNVNGSVADPSTDAGWRFAQRAPLGSSTNVHPTKWTASVSLGALHSRHRCQHFTVAVEHVIQ